MAEERLWAPWRLEYIRGPKDGECIFCRAIASDDDEANWVVHRGELCVVMLNAYPYTNGHLMIAPYQHLPSIEELGPATTTEMMELAKRAAAAHHNVYKPDGFNYGINQGKVAGAGIDDHVHMHVVPRWNGDTNFMAVTGNARMLNQSLADSWKELRSVF